MTAPVHSIGSDAAELLEQWFARCPEGELCEIRPLNKRPGKRPLQQSWAATADEALAAAIKALRHEDDVYLGVQPRKNRGGKETDVGSLAWLCVDIDFGGKDEGHAMPSAYATREDALAAINGFHLPPTFLVDTGGGFHGWWALETPAAAEVWRDAIARLVHVLRGDAAATDLPRILRLPGTLNFKGKSPRPVTIVGASEKVYGIDVFLALAAPQPPKPKPSKPGQQGDTPFNRANEVPVGEVIAWLGVEMHREGARTYCACPVHGGSNASQMVVGGDKNVATCFGDCGGKWYSPVDIVAEVRGVKPREAVNLLAHQFGFEGFPSNVHPLPSAAAPPPADAWERSLLRTKEGAIKSSLFNVASILRHDPIFAGRLSFNEMALRPFLGSEPIRDADVHLVRADIEERYRFVVKGDVVRDAVELVASERSFHPVRDYLNGLEWDGTARIDGVPASVLNVDDDLSRRLVRAWFVSAVARAMNPGCKVDTALVLIGPQGAGKSSFFSALGGAWFSDTAMDITNKDGLLQLASAWIYEWAEIEHVTSRKQAAEVKGFVTSATDTFRPPFGRSVVEHKRSSVIVGTTNDDQFLNDPTGSRRFWIVEVSGRIDVRLLRAMRDQLWAEAVAAYRRGEAWWLDDKDERAREEAAKAHQVEDPWQDPISGWLRRNGDNPFTVHQILSDAGCLNLRAEQQTQTALNRVGRILKRLGFHNPKARVKGASVRVWVRAEQPP